MYRGHEGRDIESSLNETQSLLQPLSRAATFSRTCCQRQHRLLCVRSKPAFLVTVWKFIVAAVYGPDMVSALLVLLKYGGLHGLPHFVVIALTSYASLAFWTLFFPLGGFIADVCVGRFKTLLTSLWLIWIASLATSVGAVAFFLVRDDTELLEGIEVPFIVLGSIFGLVMAVGLAGFKANVVQFGTDQMLDAPGEELSFFIHWFVWADYVGHMVSEISFTFYSCSPTVVIGMIAFMPCIISLGLVCILCYSCSMYTLFTSLPANQNPYKIVLQVLNFARKHKHPIQRSAMTYCDNKPYKRIDLGKQKYGGPFTTEQVEDVKTLLRILGVLLAACSVFVIEIPALYFVPLLAKHMRPNPTPQCSVNAVLIESGILPTIVAIILLPIYIRLVHPYFRRYIPGILKRLGLGMVMLWMSVVCNFIIDTVGHEMHPNVSCMFQMDYLNNSTDNITSGRNSTLQIDTTVLLIPNIMNGVAYSLIKVAMFEFICAQSPHSMKGLLMGLFFSLRGAFELLGAVFVVPFSFGPWENLSPTLPSCGFYYYLLSMVFGFAGIVSYIVTARKYKYRQRDEIINERIYIEKYFEHHYAEED